MFSHWSIRYKLQAVLVLLAITVLALFGSAYYGLYAYRGLVKSLSARSAELPLANDLSQHVANLRVILCQVEERHDYLPGSELAFDPDPDTKPWDDVLRRKFEIEYGQLKDVLAEYTEQLDTNRQRTERGIGDDSNERKALAEIGAVIDRIEKYSDDGGVDWLLVDRTKVAKLREDVEDLRKGMAKLPSYLHDRLRSLSNDVRTQYHAAISLAWTAVAIATLLLGGTTLLFRKWITRPLHMLVAGSREVAAGKFDHRIRLESQDEMRELAEAMNAMTARFQEIRDDLDRQVQERTRQIVRSEQLASVGFLAAGVAHEINNPLAAIALGSESLERRLSELLEDIDDSRAADRDVVRSYLDMIQKESFRCKQITEKLLDFSRTGDPERHPTDLRALVADVIEMVAHLGRKGNKQIDLIDGEPVIAEVCQQEIKQVVLNLITNALDSLDAGGRVTVSLSARGQNAEIVVSDNGCGMTDEVIKHLFEPFFTRRRSGQGTGLGLSITYRIVEEHAGQIVATSAGAGKGSRFSLTLPQRQPMNSLKDNRAA
ncbi:MAG: sensor histidine kinase [Pirellulales bacterium]